MQEKPKMINMLPAISTTAAGMKPEKALEGIRTGALNLNGALTGGEARLQLSPAFVNYEWPRPRQRGFKKSQWQSEPVDIP